MTLKKLLRAFVLSCALSLCTAPSSQPAASLAASLDEVTLAHPQSRLRKLHLVRPDLIHYPLSVEVIC